MNVPLAALGVDSVSALQLAEIRGNCLSNTTCLTQVFFKSGE